MIHALMLIAALQLPAHAAQAPAKPKVLDTAAAVKAVGGKEADLAAGTVIKDCASCPEMVIVPPGNFIMGTAANAKEVDPSRGETPQAKIAIARTFALGRTEVTRGQYKQFVAETGHQTKHQCRVWDKEFKESDTANWEQPMQPAEPKDDHPVACVSWNDAVAFAAWLSQKTGHTYRLPSTAEWEYAARAGTTSSRFWGDSPDDACQYANTFDISSAEKYPFNWVHAQCKDGYADVAPVGKFKPNAFGLYDMIGNVWEWQADCYAGSSQGRPKDGTAWVWEGCGEFHENRGGGWMTAPERNRIAWPGRDDPDKRDNFFGFRIARSLDAPYQPPYDGGTLRRVTFFTNDIAKAKAFWVDALGYKVRMDTPNFGGDETPKTLKLPPGAKVHFMILEPGATGGPLIGLMAPMGASFTPLDHPIDQAPRAGDAMIVVKVKDIAKSFAIFKQNGVRVMSEPTRLTGTGGTPTVGYEGIVMSPDGSRIIVQQVDANG